MARGFRQKTQDFESRDQDFTTLAEEIGGASAYLRKFLPPSPAGAV